MTPRAAMPTRAVARLVAVGLALVLAVGGATIPAAPAAAFDEATIHSLVNQSRAANGLGALSRNSTLDAIALDWANQMAAMNSMEHRPDITAGLPGGWSRVGENVAKGYSSGSAVHSGWMNSDGHRANILGDFTTIGIAHISANGTTWSVEVFAKYGASAPAPAPAPAPKPAPAPAPAPAPKPAPKPAPAPAPTPTPEPPVAEPVEAPTPESAEPAADDSPAAEPTSDDREPSAAVIAQGDGTASGPSVPLVAAAVTMTLLVGALGVVLVASRRSRGRDSGEAPSN